MESTANMAILILSEGASPLGLPYTVARSALRRLAPLRWLASLRSLASLLEVLEVVGAEDLPDLELGRASVAGQLLKRDFLGEFDGLLLRLHLDRPEPGDQLLRLDKRAVGHLRLAVHPRDPGSLGAVLQPKAVHHDAGLD